MKRALLASALALLACALCPARSWAQTAPPPIPVSAFDIGASPNPVGDGFSTTLTAYVGGSQTIPDGAVDFYISDSSISCSADNNDIGLVQLDAGGTATLSYYPYYPGTFPICANYIPGSSGVYQSAQAGVFLLTVNQPTVFSVNVPGASLPGVPLTFNFTMTTPYGQVPPTGTITLEDPGNGYATLGTATVAAGNVSNAITATLAGTSWYAVYSGDTNYSAQYVYGQVYYENSLSSVSPGAVIAGSPDTNITLNGLGFTTSSLPEIVLTDTVAVLPVNSVTPTQIQTTIPAAYLAAPGAVTIEVVTGNTTGGPIQLQVYAPYTVTPSVSATPATFTYGSTALSTFAADLVRGAPTDAAVPASQVSFTLTSTTLGTTTPLGTAQLAQVSTPGTYSPGALQLIDTNGTGKLISADLNNDGYTDVVGLPTTYYGNGATQPYLQLWLSTGANAFETEQQVYVGCTAQDFAVGDINGDGIPDIVVICTSNYNASGTSGLQAYYVLGNGDGTFQAPVPFGGGSVVWYPTNVVIGDFDGDGNMDVAVIDGYDGYLQVLFGTSPFGSFNAGPVVYFDTSYGSIVAAGAADFNQDGLSDIALEEYSYGSGAVISLISQGINGFTQQSETSFSATTNNMQSMAITDVNGDGYPDVVVADPGQINGSDTGNLFIFENDQTGNLPLTLDYPVSSPGAVAGPPFPVIGQPRSDAAVAPGWSLVFTSDPNGFSSDYFVTQLQRQDSATWNVVSSVDTGLLVASTEGGVLPDFIVTGDMNGDGYLDFALNGLDTNYNRQLQPSYYGNDAQASLISSTAAPVPGSYTLNLGYPGNQLYQANNTASTPVTILQAAPSGSISGPATSQYGSPVLVVADVQGVATGALPSGTVTFYDGTNPIETDSLIPGETLSSATLQNNSQLTAGLHTISVSYSGDGNYLAAPGFASLQILVAGTPVTLSLTSSTASTTAGAMVTFQVQASGSTLPAAEIVTLTGLPTSANVTPAINASGVATYNYGLFTPGTYTIQASYAGDSVYAAATSNTISLNVSSTPVTVSLASSANPVTYPAPIGLTANVTSGGLGIPTGSIDFQNNSNGIASGALATVNGASGLVSASSYPNAGLVDIAVVTGDFNHDGKQDIAALQSYQGVVTLVVLLGNGDGTFQAPVTYGASAGIDPTSIAMAAADFNGDGYTDLVIVASDGAVTTFMATGDAAGDMALGQQLAVPAASAVATGDFQHTGHPGFVVVGGSSIAVWYGTGGAFGSAPSWTTSSEIGNYVGVAVADLNQDGYADFAVSDAAGLDAAIYLYNPSSSGFNWSGTYGIGASAGPIAAGDINDDGYPDLAVVSPSDSTVAILLSDAGDGFWPAVTYGVSPQPTAIAISDFNQDGYADVAVTGTNAAPGAGTTILLGSSTGAMTGETSLPNDPGQSIASADFNSDANPDLVIGGDSIAVLLDSSAQTTTPNVALTAGTAPLTAAYVPSDGSTFAAQSSTTLNQVVNQAASTIIWTAPASIVYGTALSATQLDATSTVPGAFTYTPALGATLPAGAQTLSVSFVPTDTVDYLPATASVPINVSQASTSVTWSNPSGIVYGTALGSTQLNATASVPGTFTYVPAAGTILTAGTHTLAVTFTPTDATDYQTSTGSVSIAVSQATPVISWPTPAAITYGTALGAAQLNAAPSVPGTLAFTPAAGAVLTAGNHTLSVTFTPTDTTDYTTASASTSILVNQATPVITWPTPAAISYGTALSATQLDATATPTGGTFAYSPPAGTVLPVGTQTVTVLYTPTDTANYTTASDAVTIQVNPNLALTALQPSSAPVNSPATTITLTGSGFTSTSTVQLDGAAIPSSYISPTEMTATLPASFLAQAGTGAITVTNPQFGITTAAVDFTVTFVPVQVQLSGPATASAGDQPSLTFALLQPYPLDLQGTFTLTVEPASSGGPVDPAVQFSTGGDTLSFTIPANSLTTPAVQIQAGTLQATIVITLTLQANGQDVTPSDLQPVVIHVPASPPVISSVALTRSGTTLTVTVQGFSSTRTVSSATFDFAPAAGSSLSASRVIVDVSSAFSSWYADSASQQYGSAFSYTQTFQLSSDASTIGGVTVTLTNAAGTSNSRSAN